MSGTDERLKTPRGTEQGTAHSPHLTYRHGDQAVRPGRVCAHQVLGHLGVEVEPAGREAVSVGQRLCFPISLPVSSVPTWCCRLSPETSCRPAPPTATPLFLFSLEPPHPLVPPCPSDLPPSLSASSLQVPTLPKVPNTPISFSAPLAAGSRRGPWTPPFPPSVPVPSGSPVSLRGSAVPLTRPAPRRR